MKGYELLHKLITEVDLEQVRDLLQREPELQATLDGVMIRDESGGSDSPAIVHAANCPSRPLVELLLEFGADPNVRAADGTNVFSWHFDCELADLLIDAGARLDVYAAARFGKHQQLATLLAVDPADVGPINEAGMTPLHVAKDAEVVDLLLDHGAELDRRELRFAGTPLQWAVTEREFRPTTGPRLIERGAQADVIALSAFGKVDALRRLLQADPSWTSERTCQGRLQPEPSQTDAMHIYGYSMGDVTALHFAAHSGQSETLQLLIEHGAPLDDKAGGATALHLAAWEGREDMIRLLIEAGADPTIEDDEHKSDPAGWAAFGGQWHVTELLLRGRELSNISEAASYRRFEDVKAWIASDPTRLEGDGDGFSPLRSSVFYGHLELVRWLIDRGASVHGLNPFGKNALSLARERGFDEIEALLLDAGAQMPDADPVGPIAVKTSPA